MGYPCVRIRWAMLMPMATEARLARVQETCVGRIRNSRYRAPGILTVF